MQNYSDVAIVSGKKNLNGRLVVKASAGLPFLLQEGMCVHFVPPRIDAPRSAHAIALSKQGDDGALVTFDTVTNAEDADALVGCHILVATDDLPEQATSGMYAFGEHDFLVGWLLKDANTDFVGTIEQVDARAGQLLCQVKAADDALHLIPVVDELVRDLDEQEQIIVLDCPKGIFDL